jgi:hypothetical protein
MAGTVQAFTKLTNAEVPAVAQLGELGAEAQALVPSATGPEGYVSALLDAGLLQDAVRFLAYSLRPREAVWWACLAARAYIDAGHPTEPPDTEALAAAEAWVFKPDEDNRRAAYDRAMATQFQTPAAWAAMASFWSGGSIAPANLPTVPPPSNVMGRAVWGAVIIASVINPKSPEDMESRHRAFLTQGIDIAQGGNGRPK